MAPKQRQIRIEQRVAPDVMEQMQTLSNEQLEAEKKYRSIAFAECARAGEARGGTDAVATAA